MVKDLLLSVHDGLALHIILVVLYVNLHIHTEDVLLKPQNLLEFPSSSPGSSRAWEEALVRASLIKVSKQAAGPVGAVALGPFLLMYGLFTL
jgi:hypothetical protein